MTIEKTAALVQRMQLGDETAFDELFAAYQQEAVRTAGLITGDYSLAEDIAQETFVQCLLHIQDLQEAERFRSWFFRTLTRCAWRMMDKRRRLQPMEWCEAVERTLPPVFDRYPSEECSEYEALYRAIDGLGRKQRTTVIFYYFNGLSIREIAHITSSLEATVKSRLFAAKGRLRKALENQHKEGGLVYEK